MVKLAIQRGDPVPLELLPEAVPPVLLPWWEAFWRLSRHRKTTAGMGAVVAQPVEYADVMRDAVLFGFADDEGDTGGLEDFHRVMVAMDEAYLEAQAKAAERAQKSREGDGKKRRRG